MSSREGDIATIISGGETPHPRDYRMAAKIIALPWIRHALALLDFDDRADLADHPYFQRTRQP